LHCLCFRGRTLFLSHSLRRFRESPHFQLPSTLQVNGCFSMSAAPAHDQTFWTIQDVFSPFCVTAPQFLIVTKYSLLRNPLSGLIRTRRKYCQMSSAAEWRSFWPPTC